MGTEFQLLLAVGLVALAGVYVAYRSWREWTAKGKGGCGGGCGCANTRKADTTASTTFVPAGELSIRKKTDNNV